MAKRADPDDTSYLHEAALRRGLDTVLLPNRVLLLSSICFARGLPPSTSQGTAAMLEEQDVTRQYLSDQGISVPAWRTFSFTDPMEAIETYAAKIGYPLTLRPAWRNGKSLNVSNATGLRDSVRLLRQAAGRLWKRRGRPQSRFMIEETMGRDTAVVLVSHGDASFVQGWRGQSSRLIAADVSSSFRQLAIDAMRTLPDIQVGSVQIVAEDLRREDVSQTYGITWLGPEPRLHICNQAHPGLGAQLAGQIIDREFGWVSDSCEQGNDLDAEIILAGISMDDSTNSALNTFLSNKDAMVRDSLWIDESEMSISLHGSPRIFVDIADGIMRGHVRGLLPLRAEVRQQFSS